jgi:hypothetical protein
MLECRRLADEVALMRLDLQHLQCTMLTREDRRTGEVLLPLVAELLDTARFTAQDLLGAALNDRTATGKAAREVLNEMVGSVSGPGGLRAFGRMLARLEGKPLAGLRLLPEGEAREGRRWRLERVCGHE